MDWSLVIAVVVVLVVGVGVLMLRRARQGESAGLPTELHPHNHDEPLEDPAIQLDEARHGESGIDQAEEYRDIRRSLGA